MDTITFRKYIGRDYEKFNCLDLVKEFYKDFFGLDVKDYYDGLTPDRHGASSLIATNKGDFIETDNPKLGDVIVIKLHGIECHIGIYISNQVFLHSIKGVGSSLDRIARYKHLISGFYRHREMPA